MITRLVFVALITLVLSACASPTPVPTPLSTVPTVVLPVTPGAPSPELPTLLPTVTAPVSPVPITLAPITLASGTAAPGPVTPIPVTIKPTSTIAIVTRVPTPIPATATPATTATPWPDNVPKVYVTALSVDPANPPASVQGIFTATFQNSSGQDQAYRWCVETWRADEKKPFGLTKCATAPMPVGVSKLTSTGWAPKGQGECIPYRAKVVALDESNNRMDFIQPNGGLLWLNFNICP